MVTKHENINCLTWAMCCFRSAHVSDSFSLSLRASSCLVADSCNSRENKFSITQSYFVLQSTSSWLQILHLDKVKQTPLTSTMARRTKQNTVVSSQQFLFKRIKSTLFLSSIKVDHSSFQEEQENNNSKFKRKKLNTSKWTEENLSKTTKMHQVTASHEWTYWAVGTTILQMKMYL